MDDSGDGQEGESFLHRLLARRKQDPWRVQPNEEELEYLVGQAEEPVAGGPARSLSFLVTATAVYVAVGGGVASLFGAVTWGLADYILDGQAETLGDRLLVLAGLAVALWMCCLCGYTTIREIRRDWARFDPPVWWPIRSRVG